MLEALRQPLKGGEVAVAWAAGGCCFPARFQLTAPISPDFPQHRESAVVWTGLMREEPAECGGFTGRIDEADGGLRPAPRRI
jgi:hypothetical protein